MDIESFVNNIEALFTKNMNAVLDRQAASYTSDAAIKSIKDDATRRQMLNGVQHPYISKEYAKRKAAGKVAGQDISKVRAPKKRAKSQKTIPSANSRWGLKDTPRDVSPLGHNTQAENVDMWLTGALWDSFDMHSVSRNGSGTDIIIGFADADKNDMKIAQADHYNRDVLALTDENADKVGERMVTAKARQILHSIPQKITIEIG